MTTETPKAIETPKATETQKEEEQSLLPTVLAGAGILAVAALLIFWPSDDGDKGKGGADKAAAAAGNKSGAADGPRGGRAAGVGSRQIDAATTPEGRAARNPAIKLPVGGRGVAPMPEALPKDPPENASTGDKIEFYEKRLDQALRVRDTRQKFAERLPETKARIEASANPEKGLEAFEKRKLIVESNYEKAKQEVADIEAKLAALRGN